LTALFPPLPAETRRSLDRLPGLIDEVFPLPLRFRAGLKRDVAELSRLLTAGRTDRKASYLGRPGTLSAYLRYFLPWNIYRLSRLFSGLPLDLKSGDAINDLGSGPLTLAAALWISRPDLRSIALEFRCLDQTAVVLEAGRIFFAALSGGSSPWTIRTIRAELKRNGVLSAEIRGKPAALSAAVNIYNELFWDFSPVDTDALKRFAGNQARLLSSLTEASGSVLVVEPGIPRSGEFISMLRSGLMEQGRPPLSPCVHPGPCPLPGGHQSAAPHKTGSGAKAKWCHFAFDTEDAPEELRKLSVAAGLAKERAVLSFILSGPISPGAGEKTDKKSPPPAKPALADLPVKVRIISDAFPVSGNSPREKPGERAPYGRYGCGEHGGRSGDGGRHLVLVSGNRESIEALPSGALEELTLVPGATDAKSGAAVAEYGGS